MKKNSEKYLSYKEAWTRINKAIKAKFFLEAIVIEESIMSDRLISFLIRPGAKNKIKKGKYENWPPFNALIDCWKKEFPNGIVGNEYKCLINEIDKWRVKRNNSVHAIVKSDPGMPTIDVKVFLDRASKTAKQGKNLARALLNWHQHEINRFNKL